MKKALLIIAVIAVLGVLAAYANPLGAEHATVAARTTSSTTSTAPAATTGSSPTSGTTAAGYKDGTYQGGDYSNPYGDVQISVTISGGKISAISFDQLTADDGNSERINGAAAPILKDQTLAAQSAGIDGVSGATYTSGSYEQSLQSALDKAKV